MLILGRNGEPLYRADVDPSWTIEHRQIEAQTDTTLPLLHLKCEGLEITFHNFPYSSQDRSIPPSAQIKRWQSQERDLTPTITPTSHSGFYGLIFQTDNTLAAAFQLAPSLSEKTPLTEQRADWTIKAKGDIQKWRSEILRLIHSLEPLNPF